MNVVTNLFPVRIPNEFSVLSAANAGLYNLCTIMLASATAVFLTTYFR
jgi:hypothetical protein